MKFTRFLLPALLLAGMSVQAKAAEKEAPETITYEVSFDKGVLTGNGTYRSTWTSSLAEDGIHVTTHSNGNVSSSTANNMENKTTGWLEVNSGSSGATAITIEPVKGGKWYVSHYSFTAYHETGETNHKIASQGKAAVNVPSGATGVKFEETLTKDDQAYFVFSGTNLKPMTFKDFTVTITLDPDYVEPEIVIPVEFDGIVNGDFDEWATWYNLQLAENQYALFNSGAEEMHFTGNDTGCFLDDAHLWAFVKADDGETVKIYNKEAGVNKVLAAPKGGTGGYPRLMEDGADPAYCYTWKLRPAEYKSNGQALPNMFKNTRALYISLSDNDNAVLNNFGGNGVLSFWIGGYDQNSVIVPIVIESKVAIDMNNGYLRRVNGADQPANRWQGVWSYGGQLNIGFGTDLNNLTISKWGNPENVHEHPEAFLQLAASKGGNTFKVNIPDEYYVSDVHMKVTGTSEVIGTIIEDAPTDDEKYKHVLTLLVGSSMEDVEGSQTISLKGTETQEVNLENLPHDFDLNFVVTGWNDLEHNIILSDFTIVVKRYVREYLPGVSVYPRNTVNRQIRIPAITTVGAGDHKGRVITAYDFRWCNGDLGGGNIDLTIATSDDNGQTWTAPDFARDANGDPVTEYNHKWSTETNTWNDVKAKATEAWDAAWGDAALVADRESGTVMMIAVGGPTGFWASRRNNPQSAIRWISHDGGDTWTAAENITEKIYSLFDSEPLFAGKIDGMFFGSGRAMQSRYVKVGKYYRVYTVISTQVNGGSTRNYVLYTDDMGENWHVLGSTAQCPVKSNADEPKCEELPDGSVLLAARRYGGNRNFNVFRYTNPTTGEGKWMGDHVGTDMGMGTIHACDGEIYMLPVKNVATQEHCFLALQSFPYGGTRKDVSIVWKALSEGEDFVNANCFTRWGGRYQVCNGSSAYTTMSLMHNGNIGFFYEQEITGVYDGVFKEIPIEVITNGRYEFCADEDNEVSQQLTQALVEYRQANYNGSNSDAVDAAADAYFDNPTYANYIKFNRAEYGEPEGDADDYDFAYEGIPTWPGLEGEHPVVAELTLSDETLSIVEGKKATLTPSETKNIVWTTSDKTICTVSKTGEVKAIAPGTAEITAVAPGDRPAICVVTVTPKPSLTIDPESVVLVVEETKQLEVKPDENVPDDAVYTWKSSNIAVATVDQAGLVTAISAGEATITATYDGIKATCAVTVNAKSGDNEDGIDEINAETDNVVYDLQGRRVAKPLRGLYIVNGKKTVK